MENVKQKPLPIKINENGFIPVPRCWVDVLMDDSQLISWGDGKKSPHIPASFWKYTLFLWRYITNGNVHRQYMLSLDRFPVRTAAAVRWTAAYAVSGVFDVQIGKWTKDHDEPTEFRYHVDATEQEWQCFIGALNCVLATIKLETEKARKNKQQKFRPDSNNGAFKVLLALKVDEFRTQSGLVPANDRFLAEASSGKITDSFGRPIARVENEKVVPIFYPSVRLRRNGESAEDFDERLRYEAVYAEEDNHAF